MAHQMWATYRYVCADCLKPSYYAGDDGKYDPGDADKEAPWGRTIASLYSLSFICIHLAETSRFLVVVDGLVSHS